MSNFWLLIRKLWFLLKFTNKVYNRIIYTNLYLIFFNGLIDKYSNFKKSFQLNWFVERLKGPLHNHFGFFLGMRATEFRFELYINRFLSSKEKQISNPHSPETPPSEVRPPQRSHWITMGFVINIIPIKYKLGFPVILA